MNPYTPPNSTLDGRVVLLSIICTSYLPLRYTPLLLPSGYLNSRKSLKSSNFSLVKIFAPGLGFISIPFSTFQLLSPSADQLLRSFPLNNSTTSPYTACPVLTRSGALSPVKLYCLPSGKVTLPSNPPFTKRPSTFR